MSTPINCYVCGVKFSEKWTIEHINQHINRCLDNHECLQSTELVCPLCHKSFKSSRSKTIHIKKCAKKFSLPAIDVVKLGEEQKKSSQRQKSSKKHLISKYFPPSKNDSFCPPPPKKFDEANLQIAKALSSSLESFCKTQQSFHKSENLPFYLTDLEAVNQRIRQRISRILTDEQVATIGEKFSGRASRLWSEACQTPFYQLNWQMTASPIIGRVICPDSLDSEPKGFMKSPQLHEQFADSPDVADSEIHNSHDSCRRDPHFSLLNSTEDNLKDVDQTSSLKTPDLLVDNQSTDLVNNGEEPMWMGCDDDCGLINFSFDPKGTLSPTTDTSHSPEKRIRTPLRANALDLSPSLHLPDFKENQSLPPTTTPFNKLGRRMRTPPIVCKTSLNMLDLSPFTPLPDYGAMKTPELTNCAKNFGLRKMSRKRMLLVLKDIYRETHKYRLGDGAEISALDIENMLDPNLEPSSILEESSFFDEPTNGVLEELQAKISSFVLSHDEIYSKVLDYQALDIYEFKQAIGSSECPIKCDLPKLMSCMDRLGIIFTLKSKRQDGKTKFYTLGSSSRRRFCKKKKSKL